MNFKKLIIAVSVVSVLAASTANADTVGSLLGAAGGAVVGSNIGKGKGNIAAIAVGTLIGAGLGDSITGPDRRHTTTVVRYEDNDRFHDNRGWRNRGHGWRNVHHHDRYYRPYYTQTYTNYWVSPQPTYRSVVASNVYQPAIEPQTASDNGYCREFSQNVSIGGRIQESYGTACRQEDGSWEIQK